MNVSSMTIAVSISVPGEQSIDRPRPIFISLGDSPIPCGSYRLDREDHVRNEDIWSSEIGFDDLPGDVKAEVERACRKEWASWALRKADALRAEVLKLTGGVEE